MNKDRKVLDFDISGTGDMERAVSIQQYDSLPAWMPGINTWVANRSAAKHRRHIQKILEQWNGSTKTGFIKLTHCLSLNDTLWVKSDTENITWDQISLYKNPFDEIISKLSFDGNGLYGQLISTTSPELTTDGTYDKCWIRDEAGRIRLMKAGDTGASNLGREPYSEVMASPVYEALCDGISYELIHYRGRTASCCNLFTDENHGFKSAAALGFSGMQLPELLELYSRYGGEDVFRGMIVADAVTANNDRHYGNFGFLINNDSYEITASAPVFDYNLAFFPQADWYEGFQNMDAWLDTRRPVLGRTYYSSAEAVMTPAIRSVLINLKDLNLTIAADDTFDGERVGIINAFKNIQIDRLLGNRKQFDFTNIRRQYASVK